MSILLDRVHANHKQGKAKRLSSQAKPVIAGGRRTALGGMFRGERPPGPTGPEGDGGMKKSSGFDHVGAIIPALLKNCRRRSDSELVRIFDAWDGIVGEMVAENARPAAFKGRLVLVHVSSPAWIHHLQFLKDDLVGKINAALGKPLVEEIRFKVGPF